jgi:hypothetical protein
MEILDYILIIFENFMILLNFYFKLPILFTIKISNSSIYQYLATKIIYHAPLIIYVPLTSISLTSISLTYRLVQ